MRILTCIITTIFIWPTAPVYAQSPFNYRGFHTGMSVTAVKQLIAKGTVSKHFFNCKALGKQMQLCTGTKRVPIGKDSTEFDFAFMSIDGIAANLVFYRMAPTDSVERRKLTKAWYYALVQRWGTPAVKLNDFGVGDNDFGIPAMWEHGNYKATYQVEQPEGETHYEMTVVLNDMSLFQRILARIKKAKIAREAGSVEP